MGQAAVVARHLLHGDEVHGGVIIGEIVGHGDDLALHLGGVRALLEHHVADAGVLLAGGQLGIATAAGRFDGGIHRNGVLTGVRNALDAADGVAVPLRNAAAPEGVIAPLRQHAARVKAVQ